MLNSALLFFKEYLFIGLIVDLNFTLFIISDFKFLLNLLL